MTDTLRLAMFKTLRQKIEALPEVVKCYLDRYEEVGDNEPRPIVNLMAGNTGHSYAEFHTHQTDNIDLILDIHVKVSKNNPLTVASEPIRKAVDYIIKTEAPKCAGVRNVVPVSTLLLGESGWLGFVRCVYNVEMVVQQLNLTAAPP